MMIIVEIGVPSIDKEYEFRLNDDVSVHTIIEEILSVVAQKEQSSVDTNKREFCLYNVTAKEKLSNSLSLYENGIKTGGHLVLI